MSSILAVDKQNQLQETYETIPQPKILRWIASLFSYVFHPLFIPVYLTFFLVTVHPYLFPGFNPWRKLTTVLQVFVNCTFLPLVSILLLLALKFIKSIHLRTRQDRIIPYAITMIFYFWNWYAFKNNFAPDPLVKFMLATFITSIAGFMANIYIKISMHTMATGVVVAFMCLMGLNESVNYTAYISLALLVAGVVGTSRLIVQGHSPAEIYAGFVVGALAQVIAFYI